jgi:hypothetical protein
MARFYITVVSWLFGIGMIGCAVVLVMTFWEDLLTILGHEERKSSHARGKSAGHS